MTNILLTNLRDFLSKKMSDKEILSNEIQETLNHFEKNILLEIIKTKKTIDDSLIKKIKVGENILKDKIITSSKKDYLLLDKFTNGEKYEKFNLERNLDIIIVESNNWLFQQFRDCQVNVLDIDIETLKKKCLENINLKESCLGESCDFEYFKGIDLTLFFEKFWNKNKKSFKIITNEVRKLNPNFILNIKNNPEYTILNSCHHTKENIKDFSQEIFKDEDFKTPKYLTLNHTISSLKIKNKLSNPDLLALVDSNYENTKIKKELNEIKDFSSLMNMREKILARINIEYNTLVLLTYKAFMNALISKIPKSEIELIEMEYLI
tara:strand:- start:6321 stop:7286 length:966 start_codon:yes stop_codon:yes gene_type:complete